MKRIIAILLTIFLVACLPTPPADDDINSTNEITGDVIAEGPFSEKVKNETTEDVELKEPPVEEETSDLPVKVVTEGDLVSFPNLKATDPDGDPIKYTFSKPLNDKGEWQTKVGDKGEYVVTITASDGTNSVDQKIKIVVNPLTPVGICE